MDADLSDLYQSIILDHHKHPRNAREVSHATHHSFGHNPLCGDELEVWVVVKDGCIDDVGCKGQGCAISQASGSLMTLALKGKPVAEAQSIAHTLCQLISGSVPLKSTDLEQFGDLVALSGVRNFPARIKCATLSWHTFEAALKDIEKVSEVEIN
jgi:nitrogen fixation protein NifU and related proteins